MVRQDGVQEEITALRDDVLRVRIGRQGQLPEDASWAVLGDARHSSVGVTLESTAGYVGFQTRSLKIEIDRATMALR